MPAAPAGQADLSPLVRGLLRPDAYPHPADRLVLHETHVSWVILAGRFAYKIKKPVDFGFLDFSTVDRRAAACADEVRLNRRLCPDLYLGVVDVVRRDDGTLGVGVPGQPLEPAVRMRRLPDEGMLPALLETGAADERLMQRIAEHLASFHAGAEGGAGVQEYGGLATIRANWQENFDQMTPFVGRTIPLHAQAAIAAYVEGVLASQAALFAERVDRGHIRDGHGDLHAGSICVEGRRISLFDCVEFTPRFRCADVAADVAFLAMDLDHFGRADLGAAFAAAYVRASGDAELLELLSFYRCYRAYVRGKVLSFRLEEACLSAAAGAQVTARARAYFDLAWSYAGGLPPHTLVLVMGLPASGKSTLARELAGRLGLVQLSSDVVRKELAGLGASEHRYEPFERGLYDAATTRRTYAVLRRRAARWMRRGFSVVLDATYGRVSERSAIRRLASHMRARLVVLVCQADDTILLRRLATREGDARTVSDARVDLWPALRAAFSPPDELASAVSIDTSVSVSESVERALETVRAGPDGSVAQPRARRHPAA